jgi:hypothetical protein
MQQMQMRCFSSNIIEHHKMPWITILNITKCHGSCDPRQSFLIFIFIFIKGIFLIYNNTLQIFSKNSVNSSERVYFSIFKITIGSKSIVILKSHVNFIMKKMRKKNCS